MPLLRTLMPLIQPYRDGLQFTVDAMHGYPKMTSSRFIRLAVVLTAIVVLLINIYVNDAISSGPTSGDQMQFSTVGLFFLSRHLLCLTAAYPIARYGHIDRRAFVLLFVEPSLLLFHALFIWESKGMLELWPPILFLDMALFLPSLLLHILGSGSLKGGNGKLQEHQ